jgi:hypothetical protein
MKIFLILLSTFFLLKSSHSQEDSFVDPRDSNSYAIVQINELKWFQENLRYEFNNGKDTLILESDCGVFYEVEEAFKACPQGWRLPTEKEVKALLKEEKKGRIELVDSLKIVLCGRIDSGEYAKTGEQNTFWMDAELEDGHIAHWHTFGSENKMHSHNVIVAQRKFPVRCVKSD